MNIFALIAAACVAVVSAKNSNLRAVFKQGVNTRDPVQVTGCGCTCTCNGNGYWSAKAFVANGLCFVGTTNKGKAMATPQNCYHYIVEKLHQANGGSCVAATAAFDACAKKKHSHLSVTACTGVINAPNPNR